ncbi:DNA mismatch repair endonuclease MutL [Anaerococcus sp. AGMB09787]|uniref:DNA mismatch repair endonuclease MutL n=1 Tax=Anaerococcus sp. AGMB09787 TaxID=2922869 RepID=UPI001FAE9F3F|nr:DNA mismatch repair endonuclease MutL [Anaerococcus sp. AGMB09787]
MAIIQLDQNTIEKIAAGEVIESPVSIIKELVENSIDAGSDKIVVEIKNGGKTYIRVTDNGSGIKSDELVLAFKKHTTSKIHNFDDLYEINSLGFRGEALASIVTVSKVSAVSKTPDEIIGSKIVFDNGQPRLSSIATNTGTSIIVEDLFGNLPARRKFLKSDNLESNAITKLMYALAIGNENISFKYIKNDNIEFATNKNDNLVSKVASLFDDNLSDSLIKIDGENESYRISGYVTSPNYYRGNRSLQYIYVNGRLIDNKLIRDRVELAYRSLIPQNRYPAFFVFVTTDPKNIDVNIHPAKRQVKFTYEEDLTTLIDEEINAVLSTNKDPKSIKAEEKKEAILDFSSYEDLLEKYNKTNSLVRERVEDSYGREDTKEDSNFFDPNIDLLGNMETHAVDQKEAKNIANDISQDTFLEEADFTYKTSIFRRFSIFEKKDRLLILDHRRASEKINFDRFIEEFESSGVNGQILLLPEILNLREEDIEKFKEQKEIIAKLGFDADVLSDTSIVIRGIPALFDGNLDSKLIYDFIDIDYKKDIDYIKKDLSRIVRKLSFKRGDRIGKKEAESFLESLFNSPNPYKTFEGKSTMIEIGVNDLEKYFER